MDVETHYVKHRELRKKGYFNRPWLINGESGEFTDLLDNKSFSTEFSHTRFLVPKLMDYKGWALFMDADMIFLSDIKKLIALCDDKYAVMCVKHVYAPAPESEKMDGRTQRFYHRKNWSSFMLMNCSHPANASLTPERVNFLPGKDLHSFCWLKDNEIGELPITYNYIHGVSPALPAHRGGRPDVVHYTDGGPWFEECQNVKYAQWWLEEYEHWQKKGEGNRYTEVPTMRFEI